MEEEFWDIHPKSAVELTRRGETATGVLLDSIDTAIETARDAYADDEEKPDAIVVRIFTHAGKIKEERRFYGS